MQRLSSLLILALAPALGHAQQTVQVDFESGTLGWTGPTGSTGGTSIVPGAGNGGGAGFQTVFNDFFVTFRNAVNPVYSGDYSTLGAVTLSVDLKVNRIDFFFSPVSRPWLVELRDFDSAQGGYPWTSVWFKFADVSVASHSDWTTFSVTIDDPTSTTLPAGWKGYGAEDPVTFEPILPAGVTFADVLAGVDEVVFTTGEPGFFFGFTDFDLVLDNITIETTAGPWSGLGDGLAGAGGVPQLFGAGSLAPGAPTAIGLSNAAPGAAAFLVVGSQRLDLPLFGGTLVPNADIVVQPAQVQPTGALLFGFPWPASLPSGTDTYWQYWIVDPTGPVGLVASDALSSTTP